LSHRPILTVSGATPNEECRLKILKRMMALFIAIIRVNSLFDHVSNTACTNRSTTFTDSKTLSFLHCNRSNQLNFHRYVVTGHHHFHTLR